MGDSLMNVQVAHRSPSHLGEGPVWDEAGHRLLWVDITAGELHAYDPLTQLDQVIWRHEDVLAAVALATTGELVLALRHHIVALNEVSGMIRPLAQLQVDAQVRFNDAGVDPAGRLVIGTMEEEPTPGTAALFRLEYDGAITTLLTGLGLSNGMCWDQAGRTLYFIDSLSVGIAAYDYPSSSGALGPPIRTIMIPEDVGIPDGMTIDAEGNLWVALWGGGAVWNLAPDGELLATVEMPVSQPTSVTFAGEGSPELYITSATQHLSTERRASEPLAGSLFRASVAAQGTRERLVRLAPP